MGFRKSIARGLLVLLGVALVGLAAALGSGGLGSSAPDRSPVDAERTALIALREQGRADVRRAAQSLRSDLPPSEAEVIQSEAMEAKRGALLAVLETQRAYARERGDDAAVREADAMLRVLRDPPAPADPNIVQSPDKQALAKVGRP